MQWAPLMSAPRRACGGLTMQVPARDTANRRGAELTRLRTGSPPSDEGQVVGGPAYGGPPDGSLACTQQSAFQVLGNMPAEATKRLSAAAQSAASKDFSLWLEPQVPSSRSPPPALPPRLDLLHRTSRSTTQESNPKEKQWAAHTDVHGLSRLSSHPLHPPYLCHLSPLSIYLGQCIARRRTRRRRRASVGPQRRPACRYVRQEASAFQPPAELASDPGGAASPARVGGRSGAPGKMKETNKLAPAPGKRTCLLGRATRHATQSSVISRQRAPRLQSGGTARPSAWFRKAGCPHPRLVDERAGQGEHGLQGACGSLLGGQGCACAQPSGRRDRS